MHTVFYIGFDELRQLVPPDGPSIEVRFEEVQNVDDLSHADAFLIGPLLANPIPLLQEIYARDKYISVLVLVPASKFLAAKRALQFAPHIGRNIVYISWSGNTGLAATIENAVTKTKQRRSFARLQTLSIKQAPAGELAAARLQEFNLFLNQAPIGAVMADSAGWVVALNNKARALLPYVDGRQASISDLFAPNGIAVLEFAKEAHTTDPLILRDKAGFLEITAARILDAGEKEVTLILINDVTARETQTRKIQAILNAFPQMAWTASPEGEKNFFTANWYEYTGWDKDDSVADWPTVLHAEDRPAFIKKWQESLQLQTVFEFVARYRQWDGQYRWHLERGTPVKNDSGEVIFWTGNCTDIHNEVLLKQNLENKVRQRTAALVRTNAELEQYAHVASHDLQEPLRKIRTFASLLAARVGPMIDDESRRYLSKISITAEKMTGLLKELLNFSMLDVGGEFSQVDLNQVISSVLEDLELAISQHGADIVTSPLMPVPGIFIQLRQLFYNLVNNALKFSGKKERPVITIKGHLLDPSQVRDIGDLYGHSQYYQVTVEDNGIGFNTEFSDQAFKLFKRLHTKSEYEGTGIGLALCKKIADFHHGKITVQSIVGEGTTFNVILPVE